jgi:hypothetical protein
MTVKELITILLDYPMNVNVTIYDRDTREQKDLIYAGASPNDKEAWYDDNEMPDKVSYVEILTGKIKNEK